MWVPASLLKDIGVPVIHDLPAVGENLSDHYAVRIANRIEGLPTINERSRGLPLGREITKWAADPKRHFVPVALTGLCVLEITRRP